MTMQHGALAGGYIRRAGDTMTGDLEVVTPPTSDPDAASKDYVDDEISTHTHPIVEDVANGALTHPKTGTDQTVTTTSIDNPATADASRADTMTKDGRICAAAVFFAKFASASGTLKLLIDGVEVASTTVGSEAVIRVRGSRAVSSGARTSIGRFSPAGASELYYFVTVDHVGVTL